MPTIQELRASRNISQRALAATAGVSLRAVQRLEQGQPVLKSTVEKVCSALAINANAVSGVNYHFAVQSALERERRKTEKPR